MHPYLLTELGMGIFTLITSSQYSFRKDGVDTVEKWCPHSDSFRGRENGTTNGHSTRLIGQGTIRFWLNLEKLASVRYQITQTQQG
jgi:hypothetical protein